MKEADYGAGVNYVSNCSSTDIATVTWDKENGYTVTAAMNDSISEFRFTVWKYKNGAYLASRLIKNVTSNGYASGLITKDDTFDSIEIGDSGGRINVTCIIDCSDIPNGEYILSINVLNYDATNTLKFNQIMIRPASIKDDTFYPYIKTNQQLQEFQQWTRNIITKKMAPVFGFHISDSESDPASKATPLVDAVGMTPAAMNYTSGAFDYGSWGDVWFVEDTKPCILNQDRTIQHYLNKNNYAKNLAGDDVTIDENLTGANVMIEFPKIWYKVVPDSTGYGADIYLSPVKVDDDFVDYAYIDYQGLHKEHFYMPAYNGSLINDVYDQSAVRRSCTSKTAQQEIDYAKANGAGWYRPRKDAGEIQLINFLLMQMGMSTDTQTTFGRGIDTGDEEAFNAYRTGVGNTKGMFWGSNDGTQLVKVFGIENWWGLQWRRYAGEVLDNGKRLIKLCYGNEDGSTATDFNIDGSGYVDVGVTPSGTSGYISSMKFTKSGMYSAVSSGSASTHYCDGQWFNNAYHTFYAIRGGGSDGGLRCGAFYVAVSNAPGYATWAIGASSSCK